MLKNQKILHKRTLSNDTTDLKTDKDNQDIINRIREDPASYADYIEDSIKNIVEVHEEDEDEAKPNIIYKKKVKYIIWNNIFIEY